eukprot:1348716-Amorphochlora_amoeboformis.AAC.2
MSARGEEEQPFGSRHFLSTKAGPGHRALLFIQIFGSGLASEINSRLCVCRPSPLRLASPTVAN